MCLLLSAIPVTNLALALTLSPSPYRHKPFLRSRVLTHTFPASTHTQDMLLEWWYDPVSVPHLMLDDNNTAAGTTLPSLTVLPDALPNGGAITINLNFSLNPDSPKLKQVCGDCFWVVVGGGAGCAEWGTDFGWGGGGNAEWDSRCQPLEGAVMFSESHHERVKTPNPESPWTLHTSVNPN